MPGLLVSLAVAEGQEVKAGEELAVVEAMKMENVLRAERDGTIAKLRAKPATASPSTRSSSSSRDASHGRIACGSSSTARVQGVGFRVLRQRMRRGSSGLRGWVRNRRDGSVEALLIGDQKPRSRP